jgi:hypothetical protein
MKELLSWQKSAQHTMLYKLTQILCRYLDNNLLSSISDEILKPHIGRAYIKLDNNPNLQCCPTGASCQNWGYTLASCFVQVQVLLK